MAPNISFWRSFSSMVLVESRKTTYASAISDTGDKVELPPKRHANASRLVTPKAKDVVATTPSMPRAWSDTFLTDKPAECVEEYVGGMVDSVSIRLHECLRQASTLGGINLQGPLHAQTPIDIFKANRKNAMKSYKEAWNKANCLKSLTATGVYEAAGNVFWLNLVRLTWEGQTVPGSEISWTQLGAGRLFWSEEKFKRSAHSEHFRHYSVPCSFSTAISSSAQSTGDSFEGLPCFLDVRCS